METGHQLPPERWEADRAVAGDLLRLLGIRYIVVRPGPGNDPAVTPEATQPYIEAVMPVERVHSDPDISVYRVNLPPLPEQVEISSAAPLARLYFGDGWGAIPDQRADDADRRVWAQREMVRLFVPLDGGPQEARLRLFAPGEVLQLLPVQWTCFFRHHKLLKKIGGTIRLSVRPAKQGNHFPSPGARFRGTDAP